MTKDDKDVSEEENETEENIETNGTQTKKDKSRRKKKKKQATPDSRIAASLDTAIATEVSVIHSQNNKEKSAGMVPLEANSTPERDKKPPAGPNITATNASDSDEEEDDEPEDEKTTSSSKAKKKKKKKKPAESSTTSTMGKKVPAALAAIKQMQTAQKAAEEAARLAAEEEARLEAENRAKIEAEEKRLEELKQRKKERLKLKKEELKKQGKLLSKTEKERAKHDKLKLEQIKASASDLGIVLPMSTVDSKDDKVEVIGGKKKRIVYDSKKRKPIKKEEPELDSKTQVKEVEEKLKDLKIHKDAMLENAQKTTVLDDWQNALSSDSETELPIVSEPVTLNTSKVLEKKTRILKMDSEEEEEEEIIGREVHRGAKEGLDLRSPICCVLGHVDTGKTKLLDKIRQTSVQEGEAGGITQQIGATYFPIEAIRQKTKALNTSGQMEYKIPGLLVIDTPGHESFTNLRSRGSSLCNIAILVVDLMHGLEPQTIESLQLLKMRKTPFVVALNKIDRLYDWKKLPNAPFEETFGKQRKSVKDEFEARLKTTMTAFAEQGLNAELCFRNKDLRKTVSLVPTSAMTGEGIPDLLMLLVQLTQKMMSDQLLYLSDLECTVLEVKVIEGLGTTIDVILSNGILREGDRIIVCGLNGPIITTIRALLMPQPLRELRVKNNYVHYKEIKAAQGLKISAQDLDKAVAGSKILVLPPFATEDDIEAAKDEVMSDLQSLLNTKEKTEIGVCVQASTLGSLEALLSFLKNSSIPFCSIDIGPIHKKQVVRASVMLEHGKEYATILAFDVKVDKDAQELADELGVKIFTADIIYHLFDSFTAYMKNLQEEKKKEVVGQIVFPCLVKIVPNAIFNKRDPIIIGVDVVEGILKVGTPLVVMPTNPGSTTGSTAPELEESTPEPVCLGKVASIELNRKIVDTVRKGSPSVSIKIEAMGHESSKTYGRHFTDKDTLVSRITRQSIDLLKENFRKDLNTDDWNLVRRLKLLFNIP